MKRCVYAGSFDPLTNGHLWMIRQGASLFDELIVAVGVNPAKPGAFSLDQRLAALHTVLEGIPNARAASFSTRYLADYARAACADFILRGIRGESDYEYERGMRYVNEDLNPDLATVFLIPPRALVELSSSMVKGLIGPAGWEHVVRKYLPTPVYQAVLERELAGAFSRLWRTVGGVAWERVFQELAAKYAESHRHYHTLVHVASCLGEVQQADLAAEERQAVELAIWFHDAVYAVPGGKNEVRSAELFRAKTFAAPIGAVPADTVAAMILATERHQIPPGHDTRAMRVFLDTDLSILGAPPDRFREYHESIRREYALVPDLIYNLKRKQALKRFLARERIFLTEEFRERYENQARENLAWAIGA